MLTDLASSNFCGRIAEGHSSSFCPQQGFYGTRYRGYTLMSVKVIKMLVHKVINFICVRSCLGRMLSSENSTETISWSKSA